MVRGPNTLRRVWGTAKRSSAQKLLKALAAMSKAGEEGRLPASAAWINDSRVALLSKPGTETPRPIRIGELWRRVIAKKAVAGSSAHLQKFFLKNGQCGVALPGGADLLVHLRQCIEAAGDGSPEELVVLDLELRNGDLELRGGVVGRRPGDEQHCRRTWMVQLVLCVWASIP